MKICKLLVILLYMLSVFWNVAFAEESPAPKAVLVTGASSGIGLRIAETLAKNGFYVYAGARKEADLKRLDAMHNMSSIKLDVTKQVDIETTDDFVRDEGRGLWGIVNNAGVGKIAKLADDPVDEARFTFEVNVFGPIRINSAFLPFLLGIGGRTITIGSINGFVAAGGDDGYSASKFAMEGCTDSLAAEISGSNVSVSIVKPGQYKSKIRGKRLLQQLAAADAGDIELDSGQRAELIKATHLENDNLREPDEVAAAVLHAMSSDTPKCRYLVTPNEEQTHWTIRAALKRLLELNEDQPYSYSRDQLVALVDELMGA